MSCTSCSSNSSGVPNGCKSNGSCGTGSCDKLSVFDWLSNMSLPAGQEACQFVEVRFKNDRKDFFHTNGNTLSVGELVAVEANPGHDIGLVSLAGELVKIQMRSKKVKADSLSVAKVYRKANQRDISTWEAARQKEKNHLMEARKIATFMNLEMKISDCEFQGDGSKIVFYYTSDKRVDFRQLVKDYAVTFNARIEMKQIGYRQEAAKVGGIGSCGRELCCSTWLTDFRMVSTSAARYQQLSINPVKLAGQCGKLKCCLNYELDSYMDALKDFPKTDAVIETEGGRAKCIKVDVFKKLLWFSYQSDTNWYEIPLEEVNKMLKKQKTEKIPHLSQLSFQNNTEKTIHELKSDFYTHEQDDLSRFDEPKKKKNNNKRNQNRNRNPKKPSVKS